MNAVAVIVFVLATATALAFACWPLWRGAGKGRTMLVASLAAFMLAVAAGAYIFVGHPELAARSLQKPDVKDTRALVTTLAWRMRQQPGDPRGWWVLGRGYLMLEDPADAAAAFRRALALTPPKERPPIFSAYGEALTLAAMGAVTPDAEAAFQDALAGDPKDIKARFYLGQAYAERHDSARALALWQSLLADTPADAPWRQALIDRIALLGQTQPPNVLAMVQSLADRLKAHPDDPAGWQRLVKAYVVLHDTKKAQAALADARRVLAGKAPELASLADEARALRLEGDNGR
jgi:cytochrome c-type biogenesis protein CcmH